MLSNDSTKKLFSSILVGSYQVSQLALNSFRSCSAMFDLTDPMLPIVFSNT